MDRSVCEHAVPLALRCERCSPLGTTASILLREFGSAADALRYAERKSRMLGAMGNGMACDYYEAAAQLRRIA